jgi:hypothetical protein
MCNPLSIVCRHLWAPPQVRIQRSGRNQTLISLQTRVDTDLIRARVRSREHISNATQE